MDDTVQNRVRQGGILEALVPGRDRGLAGQVRGAVAEAVIQDVADVASLL